MAEDPTNHDLFASLENVGPDELIEFIEQFQNAVDAAEARADSQASRVRKLEADRDVLRTRLEAARTQLTRLRANPFGKLASRLTAQPKSPDTAAIAPETQAPRTSDSLRVATILDEISDACWSPEFDNIRLSRGTWRKQLEESSPDLVFVESAFGGVDGSWAHRVSHFGSPHSEVQQLTSAHFGVRDCKYVYHRVDIWQLTGIPGTALRQD